VIIPAFASWWLARTAAATVNAYRNFVVGYAYSKMDRHVRMASRALIVAYQPATAANAKIERVLCEFDQFMIPIMPSDYRSALRFATRPTSVPPLKRSGVEGSRPR
jgi:hypothetical protein